MEKRKKRKRQNNETIDAEEVHEPARKRKKGKKQQERSPEVSDVQDVKSLEGEVSARRSRDGAQSIKKFERGQSALQSTSEGESPEGVAPCRAKRKKRKERGREDAEKRWDTEQEFGKKCAEGDRKRKRRKEVHGNEQHGAEGKGAGGARVSGAESAKAEADGGSSQQSEEGGQHSGISIQKTREQKLVVSEGTADQGGVTSSEGAGQQKGSGAKAAATKKSGSGRRTQTRQVSLYEGWGAFFEARWQRFWRGAGQQRVSCLEKGLGSGNQSGRGQRGREKTLIKKEPSSLTRGGSRTDSAACAKVALGQRARSGEGEGGRHVTLGCGFIIRGPLPCSQQGCSGHARYAFRQGRKPLVPEVCHAHKLPGMEAQTHSVCEVVDCRVRASYDFPGRKTRSRCTRHREAGMFPIDRLCQIHGCCRVAGFTESRGRKATRCKEHAEAGMVNHNKLCEKEGCSRRARF